MASNPLILDKMMTSKLVAGATKQLTYAPTHSHTTFSKKKDSEIFSLELPLDEKKKEKKRIKTALKPLEFKDGDITVRYRSNLGHMGMFTSGAKYTTVHHIFKTSTDANIWIRDNGTSSNVYEVMEYPGKILTKQSHSDRQGWHFTRFLLANQSAPWKK